MPWKLSPLLWSTSWTLSVLWIHQSNCCPCWRGRSWARRWCRQFEDGERRGKVVLKHDHLSQHHHHCCAMTALSSPASLWKLDIPKILTPYSWSKSLIQVRLLPDPVKEWRKQRKQEADNKSRRSYCWCLSPPAGTRFIHLRKRDKQ